MKNKYWAFTLVELIVVITIVWILSTVGFVSYSGYLTGARDSNRFSQLTKLSDSLQTYAASKSLPLPDDYVEITASGASNVIAYQWYVWVDVLETIDYTNGGKDPKDDSYFTYYLTKDRNSLQLLALMEDNASVSFNNKNQLFAADYEERFPKTYWKKLWVLTESVINTPVQEVSAVNVAWFLDIVNTTLEYSAILSEDEIITWTGSSLLVVNPKSSCKRIKQTGWSNWNGVYTISPVGEDYDVYCDMETDGGWWTVATMLADTTTRNLFDTWNVQKISSITKDISSKWNISDIWRDDSNKDIAIQCIAYRDMFNSYEIPFIIYWFEKRDILNLSDSPFGSKVFSTTNLRWEWNNNEYIIRQTFAGAVWNWDLSLARNWTSGTNVELIFTIPWSFQLIKSMQYPIDTLMYEEGLSQTDSWLNSSTYCITYIR